MTIKRHSCGDCVAIVMAINRHSYGDCVAIAMAATFVRLDNRMCHVNEQNNALLYTLTPNLGRTSKSVGIGRYSA